MGKLMILSILAPFILGIGILAIPAKLRRIKEAFVFLSALACLSIAFLLFGKNFNIDLPWAGFGIDFSLRLYNFSSFIIAATAGFTFLIALYSIVFMRGKAHAGQFYAYIFISLSLVNGAVLSDNLILMLFFWEGLLITTYAMIAIGGKMAFKTATKSFIIVGASDLCRMVGIALAGYLAGTFAISKMSIPLTPLGCTAFILLMIGALAKAGCMPFHSWIPDAAVDAPLPFMAFFPGALEKLLGIYFLARISIDMFIFHPGSWVSLTLMIIGAVTIILAVMMALVQKDYKRLLSYHAISQVGYMVLGIGTALPVGIIGGVFHMINNAIYKSGLFLTGGSVEKQAGGTNLEKLGGLGRHMPVTFICFLITAASISGIPPFNGFFSKELIYDAALERGWIFYIVALLGSFFTAVSFLKLGHAVYIGKAKADNKVKEAPFLMLAPMIVLAIACVLFGLYNGLPLKLIQAFLMENSEWKNYSGFHVSIKLVIFTLIALLAAVLYHVFGVRTKGSAVKAADYIHYAPVLSRIYKMAEAGLLDPYNIGSKIIKSASRLLWSIDRLIDAVYGRFAVGLVYTCVARLKRMHMGNYAMYLGWSLAGMIGVIISLIYYTK